MSETNEQITHDENSVSDSVILIPQEHQAGESTTIPYYVRYLEAFDDYVGFGSSDNSGRITKYKSAILKCMKEDKAIPEKLISDYNRGCIFDSLSRRFRETGSETNARRISAIRCGKTMSYHRKYPDDMKFVNMVVSFIKKLKTA